MFQPLNKFPLVLLTLGLIVSACSTGAEAPTNAPASVAGTSIPSTGEGPVGTPALTEQASALTLHTATPTAISPVVVVTVGGPVVVTVEPANGTAQAGNPPPVASATPIPTLAAGLSPSELKFHVLAAYPDLFFCDPDVYPVAVGDEAQLAQQRFPMLQANQEEFQAILAHNSLAGLDTFSADQMLLIYRAHKTLAAIQFVLMGSQYQFQLQTKDSSGKGLLITGLIDGQGDISAQQSQPAAATCPV